MRKHAIKLRPHNQTLLKPKGSKMRNKYVFECNQCKMIYYERPTFNASVAKRKPTFCKCGSTDIETFHSKTEHTRHHELLAAQKRGEIRDLKRQVTFALFGAEGYRMRTPEGNDLTWTADWTYFERQPPTFAVTWVLVVEDKKGHPNETYPIKKEIMRGMGYEIRET